MSHEKDDSELTEADFNDPEDQLVYTRNLDGHWGTYTHRQLATEFNERWKLMLFVAGAGIGGWYVFSHENKTRMPAFTSYFLFGNFRRNLQGRFSKIQVFIVLHQCSNHI